MQPITKIKLYACSMVVLLIANLSVNYWSHKVTHEGRAQVAAAYTKLNAERNELEELAEDVKKMADHAAVLNDDSTRRYNAATAIEKRLRAQIIACNGRGSM